MRLCAQVLEARGLPPPRRPARGAFARLRVGRHRATTRTVEGGEESVVWNEEFGFRVGDERWEEEELEVGVFYEGGGKAEEEVVGFVRVPARAALEERTRTLPPTWFSLLPDNGAEGKDCGKILLTISLYGRNDNVLVFHSPVYSTISGTADAKHLADASTMASVNRSVPTETQSAQSLIDHQVERPTNKNEETSSSISRNSESSEFSYALCGDESNNDQTSCFSFEEAIGIMQSKGGVETEMPENLQGGVLLEQSYIIEPKDLNALLFEPNSKFRRDLAARQGTTGYQEGPWTWKSKDNPYLTRSVSYIKAATKFIKAVEATEEQIYLKADGKNFAVLVQVSTPAVPYGNCFQVELLYKILHGPQLPSGENCTQLVISWNVDFHQNTVMKSIIEGSAQQGLKESYESFADLLAQYVKPVQSLDKDHLLAPLQQDRQSDWELAVEYLCNFTVISTIFMGLYVLLHILLSGPATMQRLEFKGLDLPDTFGELITCGILILQGERVFYMVARFVKARIQRGSDHGIKAQGDGWLLTVALIGGSNLPAVASSGFSDPYVVFSCNGQTRTSSVQLQTRDPQWNEILEFDAMQEPPSVLDAEVFDFDGPFDLPFSLGHAEINFLKHTSTELAEMWVPLDGELATSQESKLHLRIFLDNTKGVETIKEYLTKKENEVGEKLKVRSPHRNSTFQRLFELPPEEFLINDFSCYLKRRMPLQGRLFLSARILGFYANIFGHKTKFYILWDNIEDIRVIPPSFSTVGSPAILMILRSGRGQDARVGAKSQDEEGRLRFQFQAFASFDKASRTIMGLWRARVSSTELNAKVDEDHAERSQKSGHVEERDSSGSEDANLPKACSAELSACLDSVMELFNGGELEKKIMEKVGCHNYSVTEWVAVRSRDDVFERKVRYKFSRHVSIFGGEVISTQHKTPCVDCNGWTVDEVMTLHNVPFGDHFRVYLKYKIIEALPAATGRCQYDVLVGITWTKKIKFKKRISRNIFDKLAQRSKEIFELVEREIMSSSSQE